MTASDSAPFSISSQKLLEDLFRAYKDARRHKRSRDYQQQFELNAESSLIRLRNTILSRRYKPGISTCFVIRDPKVREVFAASFRDRVVHHLLYNYIAPFIIPNFIQDSYSCIPGRGTHYGISRLRENIVDVSHNYSRPCYVLKMDIKGYFMHINRSRLLRFCREDIVPFREHLDYTLVDYLLEAIVMQDPTRNCRRLGEASDWSDLPPDKSLFNSPPECGLPIGNLTSQLFSNIYLDRLDKFVTCALSVRHYGRYVDDFYIVASSKAELRRLVAPITEFLNAELGLQVSRRKVQIYSAYRGVEFLGAYLKPFRSYISNQSLSRMWRRIPSLRCFDANHLSHSINSYMGILCHYSSYNIRTDIAFDRIPFALSLGYYKTSLLRYFLSRCPD